MSELTVEQLYIAEYILSIDEIKYAAELVLLSEIIMQRAEEPTCWPSHSQAELALHHFHREAA